MAGVPLDTVSPVTQGRLVIEGGRPLSGTVVPSGNKNAALPILAACLLTDEEVVLENVPDILDVHVMLALLDDLGVGIREDGPNAIALRAQRVRRAELDPDLCGRLRASLLLAGPMLARMGEVALPSPAATSSAGGGSTRTCSPSSAWGWRRSPAGAFACATTGSRARRSSLTRRRSRPPRTR